MNIPFFFTLNIIIYKLKIFETKKFEPNPHQIRIEQGLLRAMHRIISSNMKLGLFRRIIFYNFYKISVSFHDF